MNANYHFFRVWIVLFIISLISGGLISFFVGQDANWDLKNYHLYNAWSLLDNRMQIDIFAAGIQTYFNPLLDVPYYLLAVEWFPEMPKFVAFIMGLPFGILIFLLIFLFWNLLLDIRIGVTSRIFLTVLIVFFGVTGSASVSQIGTTFNEIQIAVLIILGVTIIIYGYQNNNNGISFFYILSAGFVFGLAAGLKLTAAIYAPAAALGVILISTSWKDRITYAGVFSLAWLLAFSFSWGWWGYKLYMLTGNPFFPMFNVLFASDWFPLLGGLDNRFKPETFLEFFFYPFFWISYRAMIVAEPMFSDPRLAFAMTSVYVMLFLLFFFRVFNASLISSQLNVYFVGKFKFLFVFIVVSYLIWQALFSILRYAISIEVLSGFLVFLVFLVLKNILFIRSTVFLIISLFTVVVVSVLSTNYPDFGRVKYNDKVLSLNQLDISPNSLIIFLGPPQAYLAPFISRQEYETRFVGITYEVLKAKEYSLYSMIVNTIKSHPSSVYVSYRDNEEGLLGIVEEIGYKVLPDKCQNIKTEIDSNIMFCAIERVDN